MNTKEIVKALEELFNDFESEIAKLETKLAYAEDAAEKGDLARQKAGGMELELKELREDKDRLDWMQNMDTCPLTFCLCDQGMSIRQAIDAAIAKEEKR